MIDNLELKALEFAYKAHIDQRRQYTSEPYIVHPIAVAGILKDHGILDPNAIAAALLHDTVEDTEVISQDIWDEFPEEVYNLVWELTDVSRPEDGNRKKRKKMDREHITKASRMGKNIKLADLIHNTQSITAYGGDFAKIYLFEKELLLNEALNTAFTPLLETAWEMVNRAKQELGYEKSI